MSADRLSDSENTGRYLIYLAGVFLILAKPERRKERGMEKEERRRKRRRRKKRGQLLSTP